MLSLEAVLRDRHMLAAGLCDPDAALRGVALSVSGEMYVADKLSLTEVWHLGGPHRHSGSNGPGEGIHVEAGMGREMLRV